MFKIQEGSKDSGDSGSYELGFGIPQKSNDGGHRVKRLDGLMLLRVYALEKLPGELYALRITQALWGM